MVEMSTSSMKIDSSVISSMWKSVATKLDFPDPDGPHIPSFAPAGIERLT